MGSKGGANIVPLDSCDTISKLSLFVLSSAIMIQIEFILDVIQIET
jgi:hypothetical protein